MTENGVSAASFWADSFGFKRNVVGGGLLFFVKNVVGGGITLPFGTGVVVLGTQSATSGRTIL